MNHFILIVAVALLASCSQSDEKPQSKSILGKWELRTSDGGMLPGKKLLKGNGLVTEFTETLFRQYEQGVLKFEEAYTLSPSKSMNDGRPMLKMVLEGHEDIQYRIRVDGTTLTIEHGTSLAADGVISTHARLLASDELPESD